MLKKSIHWDPNFMGSIRYRVLGGDVHWIGWLDRSRSIPGKVFAKPQSKERYVKYGTQKVRIKGV